MKLHPATTDPTDEASTVARLLADTDPRNGNDAAVLAVPGGRVCVSTDTTASGVHVAAGTDPVLLGRRAAARALSDLAAMGALPAGLVCAVLVGADASWGDAARAMAGVRARASEQGCPVLGGDLTRGVVGSSGLVLTVTVLGRPAGPHSFTPRAGVRPDDELWVTGALGAAGVALTAGHGVPEPPDRLRAGSVLARHAHAMIDLSDGLARDAGNLARAGACEIHLDLDVLPLAPGVVDARCAAVDGDDYELLVALDPAAATAARAALAAACPDLNLTRVGSAWHGVGSESGLVRAFHAGAEVSLAAGFQHS